MRSHLANHKSPAVAERKPREAREQGHGKKDLEKTLPAGRVENGLANARMSFSHIWFHIWSQPTAYFKVLMRPALIASGSGLCGDTVFRTLSSSPGGSPFFRCGSLLWTHPLS